MPLSQLLRRLQSAPATTPAAPSAPLRPEQLRVVVEAHPAPGLAELRLVAPDGRAIVRTEMCEALLTPLVLARFAELRFLLALELLTPAPTLTVVRSAAPPPPSPPSPSSPSSPPSGAFPSATLAAVGAAASELVGLLSHVAPV